MISLEGSSPSRGLLDWWEFFPPRILGAGRPSLLDFECTFCTECAEALDDVCPNCGGELMDRPTRAKQLHEKFPPGTKRKFAG